MVNNSTNINKTNNLLWPSPNEKKAKRPRHMVLEKQILDWNRHTNMAGLNRIMGTQPSHLDNLISKGNTYKHTIEKTHIPCILVYEVKRTLLNVKFTLQIREQQTMLLVFPRNIQIIIKFILKNIFTVPTSPVLYFS